MKITSADTYLEEGSVGITHACIKQKCTIIISESARVWTKATEPIIHSNFLEKRDVLEEVRVEGSVLEHTHTHTEKI